MTDKHMTEFLEGVIGVIEANSFEKLCLWQERGSKAAWKENPAGYSEVIGYLDDMPVCISLFTITVDGHKLLFFDPTSQVVDHRMIDQWLEENLPKSAFKTDGWINKTNAMNFHNVFPFNSAAPSPDTLRPGENDSLDTHQDKPFGAGGQNEWSKP